MGATIDRAPVLDAMPDGRTLAVRAPGRHRVDRTFEPVERHRLTSLRDAKGLVVVIAAHVTSCHEILPCSADRQSSKPAPSCVDPARIWEAPADGIG